MYLLEMQSICSSHRDTAQSGQFQLKLWEAGRICCYQEKPGGVCERFQHPALSYFKKYFKTKKTQWFSTVSWVSRCQDVKMSSFRVSFLRVSIVL